MKLKQLSPGLPSLLLSLLLPAAALPLFICGCVLLESDITATLKTPRLPAWWQERRALIEYEVEWIDPNGVARKEECSPGATVTVELPRLGNTPALVTPVYESAGGARRLLPAGALYPQDLRGDRVLEATWARGFEATLFLELQKRGYAYFQVNHHRLETALTERCGEDPWAAELDRVITALLEGSFRSSYLCGRERSTGMRELPAGGYLRENLLLPPVETVEIEGRPLLVLEGLYPGHHRFFHRESSMELLVVNDGEHQWQWELFRTEQ